MRSYRKELWFNTPTRVAFVNITGQVQECIRESGVDDGLVLVNAMHITASVFINDDESGLHHDYGVWLEKLAPHEPLKQYRHNDTGEDNADAQTWAAVGPDRSGECGRNLARSDDELAAHVGVAGVAGHVRVERKRADPIGSELECRRSAGRERFETRYSSMVRL